MEFIIVNCTNEEIKKLEEMGVEWYPDDLNSRNVVIDEEPDRIDEILHILGRRI